jgi:hypothetical protein
LNYYSQWLVNTCSTYPDEVWDALWAKHGRRVFRHKDNMSVALLPLFQSLHTNSPELFNPEFFEDRPSKALGVDIRTVKPVLVFPEGNVRPGYNVGTRGNGVDIAVWPVDLLTEVLE